MSDETTMVEYTVSRFHLESALNHYRDTLIIKYPSRFITPAFKETCQNFLNEYQVSQSKRETNPVWRVPVKLLCEARTSNIDVTVADNVKLNLIAP